MTQKELSAILKRVGLPLAYHHFDKPQKLPFMCYIRDGDDNEHADNKTWVKLKNYQVELYSEKKSPEIEKKIESIFDENEIIYDVDETYIESEKMYEVIYFIQVIGG